MHYKIALARVMACHKTNWGSFTDIFPNIDEMDLHKKLEALQVCGREMNRIVKDREVDWRDVIRFLQEMETILLLLVICMWATSTEEVPLTEDDLSQIMGSVNSLCVAGVKEEGKSVIDIARTLIEEGIKTQSLPSSSSTLLLDYEYSE
jgi:hypothetical protein